MFPEIKAPVLAPQELVPAEPVTDHVRFPVGATPPVEPVTVAVMVSLPPKIGDVGALVKTTAGVAAFTSVVDDEGVKVTGK